LNAAVVYYYYFKNLTYFDQQTKIQVTKKAQQQGLVNIIMKIMKFQSVAD